MIGVIDRIEGKIAIIEIEGEFFIEVPKKYLPEGVKDGDVLQISFKLDPKTRKLREDKIKKMQDKLKKAK